MNQIIDGKIVRVGDQPEEVAPNEVRSLIVPTATLEAYRDQTLAEARQRVADRRQRLAGADVSLDTIQRGIDAADAANELWQQHLWKGRLQGARAGITKRRHELEHAERFLQLVEEGYLPVPRMPAVDIFRLRDPLPPEVLAIIANEKEKGVFEEFSVVGGRDRWARGRQRVQGRDPILVGLCDGEMFPLAWWR